MWQLLFLLLIHHHWFNCIPLLESSLQQSCCGIPSLLDYTKGWRLWHLTRRLRVKSSCMDLKSTPLKCQLLGLRFCQRYKIRADLHRTACQIFVNKKKNLVPLSLPNMCPSKYSNFVPMICKAMRCMWNIWRVNSFRSLAPFFTGLDFKFNPGHSYFNTERTDIPERSNSALHRKFPKLSPSDNEIGSFKR